MKYKEKCIEMMTEHEGAICQKCGRDVDPETEREQCPVCQHVPACPQEGCEAWDGELI